VYVRLTAKSARDRHQTEVANTLRDELRSMAGALVSLGTGGFGDFKPIQLQIVGPDAEVLTRLATRIAEEVRQVPGAVEVDLSTEGEKPEVDVQLDRALASSIGVSAAQVAQALRPAFAGIDVGDWIDPGGETRDVTVRLRPEARTSIEDLTGLPLVVAASPGGPAGLGTVTVPLGQIASVTLSQGPAQIDHLDRRRVITVGANTRDRPLSAVVADINERLEAVPLPPGYRFLQGGESQDQAEVFGQILLSLAIAIMLMYLILVIQFGSFLDPIPIMLSLPLSLIGVMLALLVTGSTLNLMSMIGVILLMGIVAKNAILLIDFAKWAERRGTDRKQAIIEAGGVRLRPILMTSVAIVAGMLPVAIGSGEGADFRAPLGRAVIGGVITSTLLTLLVIPTAYDILSDWREAALRRLGFGRKAGAAAPPLEPQPAAGD
jgi:HAE1 family hydrophobic/amphiphilic exporter-1